MSDNDKQDLTLRALGILHEQVEARIVHYKAELETSAELDAVTAQVVRQIRELQAAASREQQAPKDPQLIENAHVGMMHKLLKETLAQDPEFMTRFIQPIGRRLAKLFFESELHVKSAGDRDKVIHHPEQGVFYVLKRYQNRLSAELDGFEYLTEEVKKSTADMLMKMQRDLQVGFLSRRSPELNRVMSVFTDVLVDFFKKHLPPRLEQMAKITVRNAKTARQADSVPYKIRPERFAAFRTEWERVMMTQMIHFCGDELIARLESNNDDVREETIAFFTDPHVYSETCGVICDVLYDRLCMEGFLDLPMDWRVKVSAKDS
jgi:hypothetical protein